MLQSFKLKSKKLISRSNLLSDTSMKRICDASAQSLEELVIRSSHCLSNQGLLSGLLTLRNLKHLDIGYTKEINDKLIFGIAESSNLTNTLEKLSLRLLKNVSTEAVQILVSRSKRLCVLDISGCVRLERGNIFHVLSNSKL